MAAEFAQVRKLLVEVELAEQAGLELLDDGHHAEQPHLVDAGFQQLGAEVEQVQVGAHRALDIRPLHLDHHLVALQRAGAVRLPDRCGAQRLGLEVREVLLERCAQRGLDLGARDVEGQARRIVLQRFERAGPLGRQQVPPRRQDLAELDEGGAQRGQEPGEALRCAQRLQFGVGRGRTVEELPAQGQARQQRAEAMARGDGGDAAQALDIAQCDADDRRRCWIGSHQREWPVHASRIGAWGAY